MTYTGEYECPDCEGYGVDDVEGYKAHINDKNPNDPGKIWLICQTCKGDNKLSWIDRLIGGKR